jgi:ADP-heptose:LPS heptosyltransferase
VWPTERFVEVANYVIEKYNAGVFICGTSATRKEADILLAGIHKSDHVVDLTGKTNIDEAKAFYKHVDLVVAVDTGPMFFAESHGTATVDIAGNIDENEQAPNDGKLHLVVVPPNRGEPEVLTMNARMINYERAAAQIQSVTVPMVTAVIDTVVPRIVRRSYD